MKVRNYILIVTLEDGSVEYCSFKDDKDTSFKDIVKQAKKTYSSIYKDLNVKYELVKTLTVDMW